MALFRLASPLASPFTSPGDPQIPGLGKAITAVDVTFDGSYVLATTDDYIMVVKTTCTDPSSGK